jgi:hypothetical protein
MHDTYYNVCDNVIYVYRLNVVVTLPSAVLCNGKYIQYRSRGFALDRLILCRIFSDDNGKVSSNCT